ncbi:General transcription factor IIH subunit 4 [Stylophora pistillata]|uniref:General transcription factor IIH subunit 4 n=1 Tax=Stylophora pistillata TaxID=50429 RepID=A0A2B4S9B8_STYPI|nr:General transcription factor IIH subunit 4 [Stylophora pistillata]
MDEAITNALDGAEDDDVWQEDDDCNPFNNEDGDDDLYYAEELDREAAEIDEDEHYIGSINRLKSLRIWKESSGGVPNRLEMNATFRSNLKIALCGGGNPWIGSGEQNERDKHARDIPFLDNYSMERWESVLHFMTGYTSSEEGAAVSQDVVRVLAGTSQVISPAGFQFLLMDTASQVWYFMIQYLETVEGIGMDLVECLSFLFQISFASLGKDYSTEGMSESQLKFLQHLREFGLVFQRKRKSRRYYPTRLAINLASAGIGSSTVINTDQKGFIVVETNYRLYAYTNSSLQVALVGLFAEILCRVTIVN